MSQNLSSEDSRVKMWLFTSFRTRTTGFNIFLCGWTEMKEKASYFVYVCRFKASMCMCWWGWFFECFFLTFFFFYIFTAVSAYDTMNMFSRTATHVFYSSNSVSVCMRELHEFLGHRYDILWKMLKNTRIFFEKRTFIHLFQSCDRYTLYLYFQHL